MTIFFSDKIKMESLSEIEASISKQCDELAEIIGSITTKECPIIVINNLKCILSLFLNSKEHIKLERKTTNPLEFVDIQTENDTTDTADFETPQIFVGTYEENVSEGDIVEAGTHTQFQVENDYSHSSVKEETDFMLVEGNFVQIDFSSFFSAKTIMN